jgi:mono/diheme cytochrome c family protein
MTTSITRTTMLLAALVLSVGFARAQETKIKKAPIKHTAADSGDEMYREYCAVCHGKTGKGDGPAVAALKAPPPDLTMLAKNNGGKFPADHVTAVLSMGVEEAAHGTKDMPVWGPLFGSIGRAGVASGIVKLRIFNLSQYLESIQMK